MIHVRRNSRKHVSSIVKEKKKMDHLHAKYLFLGTMLDEDEKCSRSNGVLTLLWLQRDLLYSSRSQQNIISVTKGFRPLKGVVIIFEIRIHETLRRNNIEDFFLEN